MDARERVSSLAKQQQSSSRSTSTPSPQMRGTTPVPVQPGKCATSWAI